MQIIAIKRVSLAIVFTALVASLYFLPLANWVSLLVEWGQQNPVLGPVVYVVFVILATTLFLPGSVAMMIGGFLFGFVPGFLFAALALPFGAQAAFEFGRWVARPWVRRKVANNRRMIAIEAALREEAFVIVVLTRLSLILPFNLLNYLYGATSVKATIHLMATAVGMLPAIALYVYLGTLARDIGQILSGEAAPPDLGYWVIAAGVLAIVAATWVIHRTATKALERHLTEQQETKL
ncbi:MAG: hypothetical protein GWP67_11510 [Gammaproteobacteria bacterium]|jgi:uncharacterized membrane protein YdjX (TVP38/TMEM64 family)|nr:hypothetical protein [Gammaproteobacteria bacterium]